MFRKAAQYRTELREKMRGGSGTVKIEHFWEPKTEMHGANRMAARLTLPPGASIGFHKHENEEELFFIVKGQAEADDDGPRCGVVDHGDLRVFLIQSS